MSEQPPSDLPPPGYVPVCAIGASAGGVGALQTLFRLLPDDLGLAYVVVVHLSPDHPSAMHEILGACTGMPVHQVTDGPKLQANCVYVIAPDSELVIEGDDVKSRPFTDLRSRRAPIDMFFRSIAAGRGDGIAVVLTGAGSDGALGVRAIKEAGGIIMVQEPAEAGFPSMPQNAIATGVADVVAPLARLAERIAEAAHSKKAVRSLDEDGAANDVRRIVAFLRMRTGHDFSGYKRSTVLRRIQRRMQVCQIAEPADYLQFLRANPEEAKDLLSDLLISVTMFFRDPETFIALSHRAIRPLLESRSAGETEDELRAWVVGCATGEEAYSLAILLLEEAEQLKVSVPIQIFATDLDEGALATAREGRYPRSIEADVSAERLKRFFIDEGTHYRINRQVRDLVLFATHSVVREPPFMRLDLITCRNVLIYLERALQQHVNTIFRYGLKMGGYLFLGPAETADTTDNHFVVVDRDARIYRAAPARPDFVSTLSPPGPWSASRPALTESRLAAARLNASEVLGESHAAALEASAPPSALVDAEQGVLHLSPSVGRFVLLSAGPLSGRLPNIVRPELRLDLKLALDRAFDARQPTITRPLDVAMEGDTRRVSLHVAPLPIDQGAAPRAIVYFLDSGPGRTEADGDSVAPTDELQHLHNELKVAQEAELAGRLRNESAVQELRASNEELQSLNEEYRSTAEELETSKEELQSINEELQTVNAELKSKLGIISEAHNDLQNLTASSEIGTLFLDLDLRIRMFTPPIADLINVAKADVGRPITNFTHRLEYDDIVADVRRVLRDLKSFESEMRTVDGRWFVVRIRPYRTLDGKVEGAVVTFDDNTGRRLAREALRQSEQIRDLALAAAEMGTWDYDLVADVWRFDARAQAMYSLPSDTLDHRPDGVAAMVHPDDTSPMFDAIKRASDIDGDGRYEIDYRIARGDGSYRWLRAWGKAEIEIVGAGRRAVRIVGASRDVTAEKDAETALRESEARHRLLIGSWAQAVWETDANGLVIADSPSWRAHTGQTLDEWLGYGWLDAIHPDDREHAERQWRETVGVQGLVSTEFRLRAPDGEWRWTNMRAAPVLDGEGRIAKWAGMNIDIDAHKRAEAMSRESEARYQALFAASPVPFMVLAPNAPDFTITAANDAYLAATFTTREGLIGRRLFDVFTDDPSRTGQLGSEALDISLTRVLTTRRTDTMDKVRYDIVTPSGKFKEHWWLALNAPVLDSSGQITAIIQQVSRVTDEYHADAALRESEKKYRDLFERIDEAFCIIEIIFDQTEKAVDYRFIEVNPAFEAHTGIADAKGLLMRDIAPGHEQHWFDYYGHVARTGESLRLEAPAKALDDRYFAFHAFRVGHPEQHRVAVVFSDITQQQRAAVALRDSEERLRNFGEASQDVLWVRDADTLDWTYLTPAFEDVYGREPGRCAQGG